MKVTLLTTDETCADIVEVQVTHITMFSEYKLSIRFIDLEEQLKFILACMDHYVLFQIQGETITIIPESNNYQRVRFRFDS